METIITIRDAQGRIGKGNQLPRDYASKIGKIGGRNRLGWIDPEKAATEHPTKDDIIWAAGVFEGEGTAAIANTCTIAMLCQKDPWVIHRFRALFGGHEVCRAKKSGKYAGREYWYWTANGARARGFLMTIHKLMSPRRQEQIQKSLRVS